MDPFRLSLVPANDGELDDLRCGALAAARCGGNEAPSAEAGCAACGRDHAAGVKGTGKSGAVGFVHVAIPHGARCTLRGVVRLPAHERRGASAGLFGGVQGKEVTLAGCWAHARRKYDEALKAALKARRNPHSVAAQGLAWCNQLFAIERELKEATTEERLAAREEQSHGAGCLLCLAAPAEIPDDAQELAGSSDWLQPEPVGQADGVYEGRSARAGQQSGGTFNQAVCERTQKLALCPYSARSQGQRSDLQCDRDGQGKWAASVSVSHALVRAVAAACQSARATGVRVFYAVVAAVAGLLPHELIYIDHTLAPI